MKLSNKLIEDVVSEVSGADVIPLVKALKNRKDVSEFKIADELKQEINLTRNMLYRLYDFNLVSFIRKKDKKKGWYIYYWTFNSKNITYLLKDLKKKKLERLKERLKREKGVDFYTCGNGCIRLDFEQATDFEFKCPECGSLLDLEDNSKKIDEIKKEIIKLEKEVKKF
jgi:transcription initiation factor TFIIE subunit alpha